MPSQNGNRCATRSTRWCLIQRQLAASIAKSSALRSFWKLRRGRKEKMLAGWNLKASSTPCNRWRIPVLQMILKGPMRRSLRELSNRRAANKICCGKAQTIRKHNPKRHWEMRLHHMKVDKMRLCNEIKSLVEAFRGKQRKSTRHTISKPQSGRGPTSPPPLTIPPEALATKIERGCNWPNLNWKGTILAGPTGTSSWHRQAEN